MRQLTIAKIKNYTLILLAISIVIIGSLFYQEKVENEGQYKLFLNRFYAELHLTILTIDSAVSLEPEFVKKEEITDILYQIENQVERTGLMLQSGNNLVSYDIPIEPIYFNNRGLPSFGEDGKIDENEKEYLKKFKNELEIIRKGIYSEETGQENPNLTIKQFSEIIIEVTNNSELLYN